MEKIYDTLIIGAGQAGLSVAYFLKRHTSNFLLLDDQKQPGGAWLHTWDSLKLFSPENYSSLSGWQLPKTSEEYPSKVNFISYLERYEKRYNFPIQRNTLVHSVHRENEYFKIISSQGTYYSKTLVSATGTAKTPYIPTYPNQELFSGQQLHSVHYRSPQQFTGQKVLIVGGGNSGAQVLADVSTTAHTQWVTLEEPVFLPDHIDGRYLFEAANDTYYGTNHIPNKHSLSNIVMVSSVKEAKTRGVLNAKRPFQNFYENGVEWKNGASEHFDSVIWCTGFSPNLRHLDPLEITIDGKISTRGTQALALPSLWLVGYGNWTGFASATIYGVGKTAKQTAKEIKAYLEN